MSDNREPFSPFIWKEEESAMDYLKPKIALELKPRMSVFSVSTLLGQNDVSMQS